VNDFHARVAQSGAGHPGLDLLFPPHQKKLLDGRIGLQGHSRAINDIPRPVIPTHHIHNHSHKQKSAKDPVFHAPKCVKRPL